MVKEYKLTQALLRPVNTSAIIILGVYTVVWGLWVGNPHWSVFERAPLYSKMSELFNESAWGGIAIIAGIVISYGAFRPSYRALIIGSGVAAIHWLIIAIMYFWGDWQSTGGITSLVFAFYGSYVYLNIRVNNKRDRDSLRLMIR